MSMNKKYFNKWDILIMSISLVIATLKSLYTFIFISHFIKFSYKFL